MEKSIFSFQTGNYSGNADEVFYDRTEGFMLSEMNLIINSVFLAQLGKLAYQYETFLRANLQYTINNNLVDLNPLFWGLKHQVSWQRNYKQATTLPGVLRIDMCLNPVGIYEIQPRPGGLGVQSWLFNSFGLEDIFATCFKETLHSQAGKENPKTLFLITEKEARFMKEMRYFLQNLEKIGIESKIIFSFDGKSHLPKDFNPDIVYVRGKFEDFNPDIRTLMAQKIPFVVPPNHFFHSKAGFALFKERDNTDSSLVDMIPETLLIDHNSVGKFWFNSLRSEQVIKPANDWGAQEVFDCGSITQAAYQKLLAQSLFNIATGKNPFVLQQKRLAKRNFPELDGVSNWIARLYFTLSATNTYQFAGGMWTARKGTIRVHGASDALVGLAASSNQISSH